VFIGYNSFKETILSRGTARLGTISFVLGILSLGLVTIAIIILIWIRLPFGPADDASIFSLGFLAVFLMFGGGIIGVPGWLTGSIARRNNKAGSNNPQIDKAASRGQILSAWGVGITMVIIVVALIIGRNIPPSGPVTPVPF